MCAIILIAKGGFVDYNNLIATDIILMSIALIGITVKHFINK